jgi:hypothetical protein
MFVDYGQYKFKHDGQEKLGLLHFVRPDKIQITLFKLSHNYLQPMMVPMINIDEQLNLNNISEIVYIANIFICYSDIFTERRIQFRRGIDNVYCINRLTGNCGDEYSAFSLAFEGGLRFDTRFPSTYSSGEQAYLRFRILITEVCIYFVTHFN